MLVIIDGRMQHELDAWEFASFLIFDRLGHSRILSFSFEYCMGDIVYRTPA
jgi:hypothetical protein